MADVDDCEVLVVENGSTDGSHDVARSFPGIQVLREPVRDPYLARNRGVLDSKGEYILFLDADCSPQSGWLIAMRSSVDIFKPDILLGDLMYPEPTPTLLSVYRDYYNTKTGWLLREDLRPC